MNFKTLILGCLIGSLVVCLGYNSNSVVAAAKEEDNLKIGVVSVRKIFEGCKRNEKYRRDATEERKGLEANLQKLNAEIEAGKAALKTLKVNSQEYMDQVKEILTKQGSLQAQQEFSKRELEMKDLRWTEKLYQDIINAAKQAAEKNGLKMVFETDEPEIPSVDAQELMMTIRTHKLLYNGGCVDITTEVMALVDAKE